MSRASLLLIESAVAYVRRGSIELRVKRPQTTASRSQALEAGDPLYMGEAWATVMQSVASCRDNVVELVRPGTVMTMGGGGAMFTADPSGSACFVGSLRDSTARVMPDTLCPWIGNWEQCERPSFRRRMNLESHEGIALIGDQLLRRRYDRHGFSTHWGGEVVREIAHEVGIPYAKVRQVPTLKAPILKPDTVVIGEGDATERIEGIVLSCEPSACAIQVAQPLVMFLPNTANARVVWRETERLGGKNEFVYGHGRNRQSRPERQMVSLDLTKSGDHSRITWCGEEIQTGNLLERLRSPYMTPSLARVLEKVSFDSHLPGLNYWRTIAESVR